LANASRRCKPRCKTTNSSSTSEEGSHPASLPAFVPGTSNYPSDQHPSRHRLEHISGTNLVQPHEGLPGKQASQTQNLLTGNFFKGPAASLSEPVSPKNAPFNKHANNATREDSSSQLHLPKAPQSQAADMAAQEHITVASSTSEFGSDREAQSGSANLSPHDQKRASDSSTQREGGSTSSSDVVPLSCAGAHNHSEPTSSGQSASIIPATAQRHNESVQAGIALQKGARALEAEEDMSASARKREIVATESRIDTQSRCSNSCSAPKEESGSAVHGTVEIMLDQGQEKRCLSVLTGLVPTHSPLHDTGRTAVVNDVACQSIHSSNEQVSGHCCEKDGGGASTRVSQVSSQSRQDSGDILTHNSANAKRRLARKGDSKNGLPGTQGSEPRKPGTQTTSSGSPESVQGSGAPWPGVGMCITTNKEPGSVYAMPSISQAHATKDEVAIEEVLRAPFTLTKLQSTSAKDGADAVASVKDRPSVVHNETLHEVLKAQVPFHACSFVVFK
jgi:hypothetical protein